MRLENLPENVVETVLETRPRDNMTPRRGGDVPLRRLSDVVLRRHWVFHLRIV